MEIETQLLLTLMIGTKQIIKKLYLELILVIALPVYFINLSYSRLISRDEGFYNMAAKLLSQGRNIYSDFFYPQMPLFPNIYSSWFKQFGYSWYSSRTLTALLTSFLALLIFYFLKKHFGTLLSLLAVFLFCFCNYVVAWYSVSQTYILSTLLLFISYFLLTIKRRNTLLILSAIAFSLSIQTRLFFAGLFPIFILFFFINKSSFKSFIKESFIFSITIAISMTPTLLLAIKDFDQFYFNNLGYHLNRTGLDEAKLLKNKIRVAQVALGFVDGVKFDAFHLPILFWLSTISAFKFIFKKKIHLDFLLLVGLFTLNLTPSPTYVQYFSTLVPFALIGTIRLIHSTKLTKAHYILITFVLIGYCYKLPTDYFRYTKTGEGVIGIMKESEATNWTLKNITEINNLIEKNAAYKSHTALFWPGYIQDTSLSPFPGTENHFGFLAASKLDNKTASKYKVISKENLISFIGINVPDYVFLGSKESSKKNLKQKILDAGYSEVFNQHNTILYGKN